MKLYIVRHGQTIENEQGLLMGHHQGILTEIGRKQAKSIAEKLEEYNFRHIYSSDLKRCVDTAEIMKGYHPNTPLTFTPKLREVNLGVLQGRKRDDVDWDAIGKDVMNRKPEGGESLTELQERIYGFVESIYGEHKNDEVLLVTHAGVIRQLLSIFSGKSSKWIFDNIPIENAGVYEIEVGDAMGGKILNIPKLA